MGDCKLSAYLLKFLSRTIRALGDPYLDGPWPPDGVNGVILPASQSQNSGDANGLGATAFPLNHINKTDWGVGAYEGASNLSEGLAIVVIQSDLPERDVIAHYKGLFPSLSKKVEADFYIACADNFLRYQANSLWPYRTGSWDTSLPPYPPDDIRQTAARLSAPDRKSTYILWGIRPLDELTWDVRDW